jgi:DNA-binding transcriptional LysR family regulator
MLGLSNFKRGCLAEEQTFRIGASATFNRQFLLPALAKSSLRKGGARYASEVATDDEIERRLHDLTLDFGVVARGELSRPLQTRVLGEWKLQLWVPRALRLNQTEAAQAFEQGHLPLVIAKELEDLGVVPSMGTEGALECDSFLDCRVAIQGQEFAALLPAFLAPGKNERLLFRAQAPDIESRIFHFLLAWNPRLLRLNPHTTRRRDWLANSLSKQMIA